MKIEENELVIWDKWLVSMCSETSNFALMLIDKVAPLKIIASLFSSNFDEPNDLFFFEDGYRFSKDIEFRFGELNYLDYDIEIVILITFYEPISVNTVFELAKRNPKLKRKIRLIGIIPIESQDSRYFNAYKLLLKHLTQLFSTAEIFTPYKLLRISSECEIMKMTHELNYKLIERIDY